MRTPNPVFKFNVQCVVECRMWVIGVNTENMPSSKKLKRSRTKKLKINIPTERQTPEDVELSLPPLQSPDRKIGQKIGSRLRNVLKFTKAHKWMCYEWFYSDIDRSLFFGGNDFDTYLEEAFPELKTRKLTRFQWTKIRQLMGTPRRCSQAFFHEERLELEKKRKKIRAIQQRKATVLSDFNDLPTEIPKQLFIGTKVTARLRKPQDGLFIGSVHGIDTSNNTYRITFDRRGLGTLSVPDFEVFSNEPLETISLSSFQNRPRNNLSTDPPKVESKNDSEPVQEGHIGEHQRKFLEKIVLITNILIVKRTKINELKIMNTRAEKYNSFYAETPEEFERNYALILIDLEQLNQDLQLLFDDLTNHCQEIAPEPSVFAMLAPSHLRRQHKEEATEIVQRQPSIIAADKDPKNQSILDLVTDLVALMLQLRNLADSDKHAYDLQVLEGTMELIKRKLSPNNQLVFQNFLEVHVKHILVGLA